MLIFKSVIFALISALKTLYRKCIKFAPKKGGRPTPPTPPPPLPTYAPVKGKGMEGGGGVLKGRVWKEGVGYEGEGYGRKGWGRRVKGMEGRQ